MNELGLLLLVLVGVGAVAIGTGVLASNTGNDNAGPVLNQYTGGRRRTKSNRKKSIKRHKKY